MEIEAIITMPPYAGYIGKIIQHPIIAGARFNSAMPIKGSLEEELMRMSSLVSPKNFYVDLKGRQIRISKAYFYDSPKESRIIEVDGKKILLDTSNPRAKGAIFTPPWSLIEIDHDIEVDTSKPVPCFFNDGLDFANLARVEGRNLYMLDGPRKLVGTGDAINILDPSLKINGFLTNQDRKYIEASKKADLHKYMLSYVEQESDILDVLELDPKAEIVAKIESERGLEFAKKDYKKYKDRVRLMAARGDLYVEVSRPHNILNALKTIINADENAILASRIFTSFNNRRIPQCNDITDIGYGLEIGYRTFMIGDDICFNKDSLESAVNLLEAIKEDYT